MIKVCIIGAGGRMGKSIFSVLNNDNDVEIVGGTELEGHGLIGSDLGTANGVGENGVLITQDINEAASDADVIVDFSAPVSTLKNAEYASGNNKAIVIGTTGFSAEERASLDKMIETVPSVIAPNMSIGVNLLFELSKNVSKIVGSDFDVEIVEAHHRNKVDSPSGTALGLAESVAEGLGVDLNDKAVYERHGNIGKRKEQEIGIQTIRGGDVVGDHTVMFLGDGERIELTHKALNRDNFSKGVLRAVKWIPGKEPGIYTMKDVLGL